MSQKQINHIGFILATDLKNFAESNGDFFKTNSKWNLFSLAKQSINTAKGRTWNTVLLFFV